MMMMMTIYHLPHPNRLYLFIFRMTVTVIRIHYPSTTLSSCYHICYACFFVPHSNSFFNDTHMNSVHTIFAEDKVIFLFSFVICMFYNVWATQTTLNLLFFFLFLFFICFVDSSVYVRWFNSINWNLVCCPLARVYDVIRDHEPSLLNRSFYYSPFTTLINSLLLQPSVLNKCIYLSLSPFLCLSTHRTW